MKKGIKKKIYVVTPILIHADNRKVMKEAIKRFKKDYSGAILGGGYSEEGNGYYSFGLLEKEMKIKEKIE